MRVADLAHGRSGDKGDTCNVGIVAWDDAGYATLRAAAHRGAGRRALRRPGQGHGHPLRAARHPSAELRPHRRAGRRRHDVAAVRPSGQGHVRVAAADGAAVSDAVVVTRRGSMAVAHPEPARVAQPARPGAVDRPARCGPRRDGRRRGPVGGHRRRGLCVLAGGDLRQMQPPGRVAGAAAHGWPGASSSFTTSRSQAPKPLVALVDGPAYAGGFGLAGICDIVLAAPTRQLRAARGTDRAVPDDRRGAPRPLAPAQGPARDDDDRPAAVGRRRLPARVRGADLHRHRGAARRGRPRMRAGSPTRPRTRSGWGAGPSPCSPTCRRLRRSTRPSCSTWRSSSVTSCRRGPGRSWRSGRPAWAERRRWLRRTSSTRCARPVGKRGGALSAVHPADLGAHGASGAVERTGVDPAAVDDVVCGCVEHDRPAGGRHRPHVLARRPGFPERCPARPSTGSAARRSRPCTSRRRP